MPRGRRTRQRVLALNGVATVGLARLTHCIARTCMQAREKSLKNFGLGSIALPTRPTARRGRRCSAGHAAQLAHLRGRGTSASFRSAPQRGTTRVVIGSILGCPVKRFGAFTVPHALVAAGVGSELTAKSRAGSPDGPLATLFGISLYRYLEFRCTVGLLLSLRVRYVRGRPRDVILGLARHRLGGHCLARVLGDAATTLRRGRRFLHSSQICGEDGSRFTTRGVVLP
jgi:hypothetical protein